MRETDGPSRAFALFTAKEKGMSWEKRRRWREDDGGVIITILHYSLGDETRIDRTNLCVTVIAS